MAMPRQNGGALTGVRLTDIPVKIRRRYGGLLLDRALKELEPLAAMTFAAQLERAVEDPSDTLYWVAATEVDRVLSQKPGKKR
jgi:hypothetical protein